MNESFNLENALLRAKEKPHNLSIDDLTSLLALNDEDSLALLNNAAREVKLRECGRGIAVRGLVEAGNICAKDCFYCGIRKSNSEVSRYMLDEKEIYEAAVEAKDLGYASLVIQSGEIESEKHTKFVEDVLIKIKHLDLGVTLSLGEQEKNVFARWRNAGATRYLLRIETSNRELYERIHPKECDWRRRVNCLKLLRETGYQVGTGVMCALPGQTLRDLARDIVFFKEIDADMIGMGPYIPHPSTPLMGDEFDNASRLQLALKMIAVTRLYLHNVNIASSTALQALADDGREKGILSGANVLMPNVTSTRWRKSYQLYAGKPSLDEQAISLRRQLEQRISSIGEFFLYDKKSDSPHYKT